MAALLSHLRIKNLALVEEVEWPMNSGFIAVTGETGAGKSIIIGALNLLLGERADKSLIRTGNAPQVWSAITNLVITLFRIHGVTSFTEEARRCAQDPRRALRMLDLTCLSPG